MYACMYAKSYSVLKASNGKTPARIKKISEKQEKTKVDHSAAMAHLRPPAVKVLIFYWFLKQN